MIAIINYDSEGSKKVSELLNKSGIEHEITKNEKTICRADRIILPDCENVKNVSKKIQLYNLTSVIKMIKKPILGLYRGGLLMSENVNVDKLPGFGFFKNVETVDLPYETNNDSELHIVDKRISKVLQNSSYTLINGTRQILVHNSELTSFTTMHDGHYYSGIIENNNFIAVYFDILNNKKIASELMANFNSL